MRERQLDGLVLAEARQLVGRLRRRGRGQSERDGRERGSDG
jgi:hypothetical protein